MMNNENTSTDSSQVKTDAEVAALSLRENLMAIHVAGQLMCRQSEGRQTYPVAKSIVMLTEQALQTLKDFPQDAKGNM